MLSLGVLLSLLSFNQLVIQVSSAVRTHKVHILPSFSLLEIEQLFKELSFVYEL